LAAALALGVEGSVFTVKVVAFDVTLIVELASSIPTVTVEGAAAFATFPFAGVVFAAVVDFLRLKGAIEHKSDVEV